MREFPKSIYPFVFKKIKRASYNLEQIISKLETYSDPVSHDQKSFLLITKGILQNLNLINSGEMPINMHFEKDLEFKYPNLRNIFNFYSTIIGYINYYKENNSEEIRSHSSEILNLFNKHIASLLVDFKFPPEPEKVPEPPAVEIREEPPVVEEPPAPVTPIEVPSPEPEVQPEPEPVIKEPTPEPEPESRTTNKTIENILNYLAALSYVTYLNNKPNKSYSEMEQSVDLDDQLQQVSDTYSYPLNSENYYGVENLLPEHKRILGLTSDKISPNKIFESLSDKYDNFTDYNSYMQFAEEIKGILNSLR